MEGLSAQELFMKEYRCGGREMVRPGLRPMPVPVGEMMCVARCWHYTCWCLKHEEHVYEFRKRLLEEVEAGGTLGPGE